MNKHTLVLITFSVLQLISFSFVGSFLADCPNFTDENIREIRLYTTGYKLRFIASRQSNAAYLEQDLGAITQFANIEYSQDGWNHSWETYAPIIQEVAYYVYVYNNDDSGADWLVMVFHSSEDTSIDYPAFFDLNNPYVSPRDNLVHPNCWLKTDSIEYIEFIELVTAQYESWQTQIELAR